MSCFRFAEADTNSRREAVNSNIEKKLQTEFLSEFALAAVRFETLRMRARPLMEGSTLVNSRQIIFENN
jgi:hypothetical protein